MSVDDVPVQLLRLPHAAPTPVLALGAHLKNRACWLQGDEARFSALHGDLDDPAACEALAASAPALAAAAGGRPAAVAHDLHPDFFSTRLALRLAAQWGVPAIAVQHHRAHIAAVQAEEGPHETAVIGIALDGVGLGIDGTAWGGEVLWLEATGRAGASVGGNAARGAGDAVGGGASEDSGGAAERAWQRCAHLRPLPMPGGDRAAREPWRMAAAVLHAAGRGGEIEPRFGALAGNAAAALVSKQLDRGLFSPSSTAAGRWFDAAAAALGLHTGPQHGAEAAQALQSCAERWVREHGLPEPHAPHAALDLRDAVCALFDCAPADRARAAALFHANLAAALAAAAIAAAHERGVDTVLLGGGCFHNALLEQGLRRHLEAASLRCLRPQQVSCGDAGIALGQAWVASWLLLGQH